MKRVTARRARTPATKLRTERNTEDDGRTVLRLSGDWRVAQVLRDLEDDPHDSISALAKRLGVSRWHLSHVAREELGINLRAYRREYQLQTACRLLATTELPIKEIRWRCGIRDASNFSHEFRERFGMSPKVYRIIARRCGRSITTFTSK
jgi:AraC-like DNA-binding protein